MHQEKIVITIDESCVESILAINLNARKGDINILADTSTTSSFDKSFALSGSIALIGKGGSANLSKQPALALVAATAAQVVVNLEVATFLILDQFLKEIG